MALWQLRRSHGFTDDLRALAKQDRQAAAAVVVLLEELEADEEALERLSMEGETDYERGISSAPLRFLQREGINCWRLRPLPEYPRARSWRSWRLLYALDFRQTVRRPDPSHQTVWFLAILAREEDYNEHDPRIARAVNDYKDIGIRPLPGG